MRICNRFHLEDAEPGDRIKFRALDTHRDDWEGPREFTIDFSHYYVSPRFGVIVYAKNPVSWIDEETNEPMTANEFYLEDEWHLSLETNS